jgi:hypothetical protein
MYVKPGGNDEGYTIGIYGDSSDTPNGSPVIESSELNILSTDPNGWFAFTASGSIGAVPYHIANAHGDYNSNHQIGYLAGATSNRYYDLYTYSPGNLPDPIAPTYINGWEYSQYVTYTPSGGGGNPWYHRQNQS